MKRAILGALAALALVSCNVFNPSGNGDLSGSGADGYIIQGQTDLRNQDFAAAVRDFNKALSIDSTRSLAWHGLGKAYVGDLPMDSVLAAFQTLTKSTDSITNPFANSSDSLINALYRPLARMVTVYGMFIQRDTTGRTDGVFSSRGDMLDYTVGQTLVLAISPMILSSDSLMDSTNKLDQIGRTLNQSLSVDSLAKGGTGSIASTVGNLVLAVDSSTCKTDSSGKTTCQKDTTGKYDSSAIKALNAKFVQIGTSLSSIQSAASALGATTDTSKKDSSSTSSITSQAQAFVKSNPSAVKLIQFADGLDNDGNGCVDEKISDGLDGMGDGVPGDYRMGYRDASFVVAAGNLALNAQPDGIADTRLADLTTDTLVNGQHLNKGVKGTATNVPLYYADASGHLEFARPYWDSTNASYATKHWVKTLAWTIQDAATDTVPVVPVATVSATGVTTDQGRALTSQELVEIRLRLLAINDMHRRWLFGRKYVGGCWMDVTEP
jgi:hypothetical protein